MSKTDDTPTTDAQPETARFEKDVILTFYGHSDYEDDRAFIDDVFGDHVNIDLDATSESTKEIVELELSVTATDDYDREWTVEEKVSPFTTSDKQVLRNAVQSGQINTDELDWLDATIEEQTRIVHDHRPSTAIERFLQSHYDSEQTAEIRELLDTYHYGESEYSIYAEEWEAEFDAVGPDADPDDTESFRVRVNSNDSDIDRRRVLVHQDDRTSENRFVDPDLPDDEQPWSSQITVSIEAPTQDRLDELSGALVPDLYAELAHLDGITTVRLTDCETVTRERGECYNV